MAIDKEILDKLLADYKGPEDLIGESGLLKQLTKALRCAPTADAAPRGLDCGPRRPNNPNLSERSRKKKN